MRGRTKGNAAYHENRLRVLILGAVLLTFGQGAVPKEKYSVKVRQSRLLPAEFTLKINRGLVGAYDDNADVDVTDRMRLVKNTVSVAWKLFA